MDDKIAVNIFGSCVTRDVFANLQDAFTVDTYIARQSFISSVDKPISLPCPDEEVKSKSAFQKRMVLSDLRKTAFDEFSASTARFLVIDFVDERFQLGKINGSLFTLSTEYAYSQLFPECVTIPYTVTRVKGKRCIPDLPLDERMHEFACRISALYPGDHIILHAAQFVDFYIDREKDAIVRFDDKTLARNDLWNEKLDILYSLARKYLPPLAAFLNYTADYCADSAHQWGLSSCHYQPEYYRRVADDISMAFHGQLSPISSLLSSPTTKGCANTPRSSGHLRNLFRSVLSQ